MNVSFKMTMGMTLYHKYTMKELKISNVIEQSYDENSEEYREVCKRYEGEIGFKREQDVAEYDKMILAILSEEAKEKQMGIVSHIEDVVKNCYYQGTTAYISFGGYMINPNDFCAIRVDGFDIKFSKK